MPPFAFANAGVKNWRRTVVNHGFHGWARMKCHFLEMSYRSNPCDPWSKLNFELA